jgi:DNA-binding beta-propeller fold protein YncE
VYVTDRDNCKVEKLTADGNFIRKWGSLGRDDGEFIDPHGIDFDSSDSVYVVDSQNERIQKFDSDGNFITKWGSEGYGDGQFWLPHDIAIDSSDNVYVSDSGICMKRRIIVIYSISAPMSCIISHSYLF